MKHKAQKAKRWAGSGLAPPAALCEEAAALVNGTSTPADAADLRRFGQLLQALLQAGGSYAEIEALKPLCACVVECGTRPAPAGAAALRRMQSLLAALLLAPNSRPLHRPLLSGLRPLLEQQDAGSSAETFAEAAAAAMAQLAEETLLLSSGGSSGDADGSSQQQLLERSLRLGSALVALLNNPPCKPALLRCAAPAVVVLAAGLHTALQPLAGSSGEGEAAAAGATAGGAEHIPSDTMEALQESVSALYYLQTSFGPAMLAEQPDAATAAVAAAGEALLLALRGQSLAREALASAAVALYASAALPAAAPAALARCFAEGLLAAEADGAAPPLHLLLPGETAPAAGAAFAGTAPPPAGLLDAHLRQEGSSLVAELRRLPPLSRLCAVRGLLSALPGEVSCAPLRAVAADGSQAQWLLLVDGALPAVSAAVQGTTDEHFRFHAFSTLAALLERLRYQQQTALGALEAGERLQADGSSSSQTAAAALPLLDGRRQGQLMQLLWLGFEASLPQTLQRVHVSFDCLLDILALQPRLGAAAAAAAASPAEAAAAAATNSAGGGDDTLLRIARDVLALDAGRKARYAPLHSLVPRVGASRMLALQPGLVAACLEALAQAPIANAVASFLLALLAQLQREAAEADAAGAAAGDAAAGADWRASWLPLLAAALRGGSEAQRSHLTSHLLPQLLIQDPLALGLLLQQLLPDGGGSAPSSDGAAAGGLAVLKAARKQQLLSDLDGLTVAGLDSAAVQRVLLAAVRSGNEGLRLDALSMVCCHPKTFAPPKPLELEVASEAILLTLRCPSSSLRHNTLVPLAALLQRTRGAVASALGRRTVVPAAAAAVEAQRAWLHWLGRTLVGSLYPGASHARSCMALELLQLLLEAWGDTLDPSLPPPSWAVGATKLRPCSFEAFPPDFCSQGTVQLLLAAALDSWERLREAAAAVLLRLPTPLPGAGSAAELRHLLGGALRLLGCPRGRDADAGAQLLLLLFRKYGGGGSSGTALPSGCWSMNLADGTVQAPPEGAAAQELQAGALWTFLSSGCDLLQRRVEAARADMLGACRGGLALGALLAMRYALLHVPWARLMSDASREDAAGRDWRSLVARLLQLTYAAADLTLPVLAAAEGTSTDAAEVDADDVALAGLLLEGGEEEEQGGEALGPRAQVINTACWQTSKEAALLLGGLAQALPIGGPAALLSAEQLSFMAEHLTHTLCTLKHNGAVDKTQQGFAALCERLLRLPDPALRQLPQRCLLQLLAHMRRPGQGRGDIVRRSAGLPLAVLAIFGSEPDSSPKALLRRGMGELLAGAGDTRAESWPRVHAFNCLRVVFQHSALAVDTSAFLADGLQTTVLGMGAPQWEVRSAAGMCYAALLFRLLGFRNHAAKASQGPGAAKRAPTAADFFARHPPLHAFLLAQLGAAAAALDAAAEAAAEPAAAAEAAEAAPEQAELHPSLFPVLVLLSRLRPSQHSRLIGGAASSSLMEQRLSPAAFVPLLQRCAAARPMAVRQLAATSLAPLLPPAQHAAVAGELAEAVAEGVAAAAVATQGGGASALRPSFNALHGQLLQLRALLEAAASAGDSATAAALLAAVARPLAGCAPAACMLSGGNTASGSYVPAAVSLEFIRAAAAGAALLPVVQAAAGEEAAEATVAAAAWLTAVQRRCWAETERSGVEPSPADYRSPMLSLALKHAAQLCFSLLLQQQAARRSVFSSSAGGSLLPQLATALRSNAYEVRGAALKVLLRHFEQQQQQKQQLTGGLQSPALRSLLRQALQGESHHKAQRRLLALLALVPPAAAGAGATAPAPSSGAALAEWQAMLARAGQAGNSRIRQHAVRCLAPLLDQLLLQSGGIPAGGEGVAAAAAAAASSLLPLLGECSGAWQPVELRLAATAALATCGLLPLDPRQSEAAADVAAGAWDALISLLEDDDEEVRAAAALAAAAALPSLPGESSNSSSSSGVAQETAAPSDERLLRCVFPALSDRFGPKPSLLALLCRRCCPDAASAVDAASAAADAVAVERGGEAGASAASQRAAKAADRIFDREADNVHEEPLLLAQLAARDLARLLPQAAPAPAAAVQAWAAAALRQLERLAAALQQEEQRQQQEESNGGSVLPPTHQRFAGLYQCWLALWAASQLPASDDGWHSGQAAAVAGLVQGAAGAQAAGTLPQLAAAAAAAAAGWQRLGGGAEDAGTASPLFLI